MKISKVKPCHTIVWISNSTTEYAGSSMFPKTSAKVSLPCGATPLFSSRFPSVQPVN